MLGAADGVDGADVVDQGEGAAGPVDFGPCFGGGVDGGGVEIFEGCCCHFFRGVGFFEGGLE